MTTNETYQTNSEFKAYIDKFMINRTETKEEIFKHKIIQDIAEYYNKKANSVPDNWNEARK